MAQFDIYRNDGHDRKTFPYVMAVQSDLFEDTRSIIVIPLIAPENVDRVHPRFQPRITLAGETWACVTQLMTAVPRAPLGAPVGNAASYRADILAAIDLLFTGI
ncbi:MAG: CcdB family protein [Pseudomonadota bacterium]